MHKIQASSLLLKWFQLLLSKQTCKTDGGLGEDRRAHTLPQLIIIFVCTLYTFCMWEPSVAKGSLATFSIEEI
uniref:Uncharacterized protein n=1 Tax=Romanomermis culicivorax TaxID=13658 RepID=A0A915HJ10_ROMCU